MAAATVGPIRRFHMICRGTPTTACSVRSNGAGPSSGHLDLSVAENFVQHIHSR